MGQQLQHGDAVGLMATLAQDCRCAAQQVQDDQIVRAKQLSFGHTVRSCQGKILVTDAMRKAGCEDTLSPPARATTPAAPYHDSALPGLSTRANTLDTSGCEHSIARVAALQAGAEPKLTRRIETPEQEVVQQLALVGNPRRMQKLRAAAPGRAVVRGQTLVAVSDLLDDKSSTSQKHSRTSGREKPVHGSTAERSRPPPVDQQHAHRFEDRRTRTHYSKLFEN